MKLRPILLALVLLAALPFASGGQDTDLPPTAVAIDSGVVSGEAIEGEPAIRAYRGIPFARPPVGDLRWRPPQPALPWEGVRECVAFGPSCPQPDSARLGQPRVPGAMSEDCLYLNVWTRAREPGAKLPVMVWIHGGGFTIGSSSLRYYDGRRLASRGVVLVSVNYRLGPFGFLGHELLSEESEEGVSGNYGLLDQIAALRWVKRNIAAFGGDPDRVTIFGESAGAVSVLTLMVTPSAKGLFHRAIAQSGSVVRGVERRLKESSDKHESLHARGADLLAKLGIADEKDPLAALRALPSDEILAAADPKIVGPDRDKKYGPVVDGRVLPDAPLKLWSTGRQHDVPLLLGSNADDGGVFSAGIRVSKPFGYRLLVRSVYEDGAKDVLKLFPPDREATVPLTVRKLLTISSFVVGARQPARDMEKVDSPAYLYHFTRVPKAAERAGLGAAHGLEIPYIFGTEGPFAGFDETDDRLADAMQRYWIAFATNGTPSVEGLPAWPAYDRETDRHLTLGDEIRPGSGLHKAECDLFERLGR